MKQRASFSAFCLLPAVLSLFFIKPAAGQPVPGKTLAADAPRSSAPKAIGRFGDWIAATYLEAGHLVCFTFTRPIRSAPKVAHRGGVVLSVSHRRSERDVVAMDAGFRYATGSAVAVRVHHFQFKFHALRQGAAFARDGHGAVAEFKRGRRAFVHSRRPHRKTVVDTFSLTGFSSAYHAISEACPPKRV